MLRFYEWIKLYSAGYSLRSNIGGAFVLLLWAKISQRGKFRIFVSYIHFGISKLGIIGC